LHFIKILITYYVDFLFILYGYVMILFNCLLFSNNVDVIVLLFAANGGVFSYRIVILG